LHLKNIPYEIVEEPLREWTSWMKDWSFANNERARVPVLRYVLDTDVEKIVPESNEMNLFLDAFDGNPTYTPQDEEKHKEMKEWWTWCDRELKPMIDLYKYGVNLQFNVEIHVLHTAELQKLIQILEDRLSDHTFLVGETLTLADIAIIPFIRQIMRTREGEFDFTSYPSVKKWTNSIIETDWFQEVVMKIS
jgi:glutathione S-transferase